MAAYAIFDVDILPRRLVLLEFPSMEAMEAFCHSPVYQS